MKDILIDYAKKLKLGREFLDDFEDIPFTTKEEYLVNVLKRAFEYQQINRKNRLLKQAKFEVYKSLENYDYSNVEFPETLNIEELVEGKFIENKENLIFYGPVGTGKTQFLYLIFFLFNLFFTANFNTFLVPIQSLKISFLSLDSA